MPPAWDRARRKSWSRRLVLVVWGNWDTICEIVSGGRWLICASPPWRLSAKDQLHHLIQGRKWEGDRAEGRRRRRRLRRGGASEPAFGNNVAKARNGGILNDAADRGGGGMAAEDRYATTE